jgi:hypothetical protein
MKRIRWRCLCIKEPRVLLAMLPLTLGLAAVDAQLAACERAVCGGGWVGSEAGEASGFTEERLIGEMVECYTACEKWKAIMNTGTQNDVNCLRNVYLVKNRVVEALIKAGGDAYPPDVVNSCKLAAVDRMNASKAGGGGSKGGSN